MVQAIDTSANSSGRRNSSSPRKSNNVDGALQVLQPIRDLAKNWDIDIASCLQEYLDEVLGDLSTEDRAALIQSSGADAVTLNFAQAALVLQSSSHVYSRKVEYLYTLVYKALEELVLAGSDKKSAKQRQRRLSGDTDLDEFLNFDPHQEFLLLDDVVPTDPSDDCHAINLSSPTKMSSWTPNRRWSVSSRRVSLQQSPSTNHTLGSMHSLDKSGGAAAASLFPSQGGSLRLVQGQCDIGPDGLLRMPGTASLSQEPDHGAAIEVDPLSPGIDNGGEFMDDHDDHDNEGSGFAMAEDFGADTPMDSEGQVPVATALFQPSKRVTFAASAAAPKRDPWELLDPHSPSTVSATARPLRIGKTIVLPPGVDQPPSASVTGAMTRPQHDTLKPVVNAKKVQSWSAVGAYHAAVEDVPAVPISQRGLAFGEEFAYIAKATAKRKAAERRAIREEIRAKDHETPAGMDQQEEEDEEEYAGGWDYGGDDHDDDDHHVTDEPVVGNTGMVSMDEVYAQADDNEALDNDAPTGLSFGELCRAHVQRFARGAEKYASETRLSQRVHAWQERLLPLLEQENARPAFDIHAYGSAIIESVQETLERRKSRQSINDTAKMCVDFGDVTKNCPPHEVCRLFLASLSLANAGNLELGEPAPDGSRLPMRLVSEHLERPMETYMAPSMMSAQESQS